MVRADRRDTPGSWHHVVNRGVARRSVFEDRADFRFFLPRLARVGRLAVSLGTVKIPFSSWAISEP